MSGSAVSNVGVAGGDILDRVTAAQTVIVAGSSVVLITAMTAAMIRMNRSQRRTMERRRAEWVAGGSIPEEEPHFGPD